jgi:hypothetical protein
MKTNNAEIVQQSLISVTIFFNIPFSFDKWS